MSTRGAGHFERLEKSLGEDLLEEKASALGRVTRGMEGALLALADARDAAERAALVAEAAEWLWFVVVQREAMGLCDHDPIFRSYDIPTEVRRRMGPRKRTPHQ